MYQYLDIGYFRETNYKIMHLQPMSYVEIDGVGTLSNKETEQNVAILLTH
jgi:hypothetical protein